MNRFANFSDDGGAFPPETWLTPPALLLPLGRFDLDPCAAPLPRPWPTADRMLSLPIDGFAAKWKGRVWLNPPYGKQTGVWLKRLADHGNGIALVFARTETAMFAEQVWPRASGILFLTGRVTFCRPDGRPARKNAGAPSCLVAYGMENADVLHGCQLDGAFMALPVVRRTTATKPLQAELA